MSFGAVSKSEVVSVLGECFENLREARELMERTGLAREYSERHRNICSAAVDVQLLVSKLAREQSAGTLLSAIQGGITQYFATSDRENKPHKSLSTHIEEIVCQLLSERLNGSREISREAATQFLSSLRFAERTKGTAILQDGVERGSSAGVNASSARSSKVVSE